ncbi:MAG: hypothetical protein NFW04_05270 [Candidatus Accumulibacter sp.]|uniref:hypothetical protein n=1 Tax=Accumulibacter sp. TaxID=2053492 RepID=UPI0025F7BF99|nr:hypothetical protein [Accumulibacter sp.]MCM8598051.1 hypothetical protein [Accumulibacter sp.]
MRYRVLSPVSHGTNGNDSRRYEPGEIIDLNESHAAPLLACGAIEAEHQPFDLKVDGLFIKTGSPA